MQMLVKRTSSRRLSWGLRPPALIKSAFSVWVGSAEPTHKVQGNVAFAQWPKGPSRKGVKLFYYR